MTCPAAERMPPPEAPEDTVVAGTCPRRGTRPPSPAEPEQQEKLMFTGARGLCCAFIFSFCLGHQQHEEEEETHPTSILICNQKLHNMVCLLGFFIQWHLATLGSRSRCGGLVTPFNLQGTLVPKCHQALQHPSFCSQVGSPLIGGAGGDRSSLLPPSKLFTLFFFKKKKENLMQKKPRRTPNPPPLPTCHPRNQPQAPGLGF